MHNSFTRKYRYPTLLLRELVKTDFKLRYQGSVLGYLWSLLRPLFLFVILYVVFVNFLKIGDNVPHWPIGMLLGIVIWNFFAEVTNTGIRSIVEQGDVIRKINFPKYVIVLASSVSAFINLCINLVVIAVFMAIDKVDVTWAALYAPIVVFELFFFSLGVAFLLGSLYVKLRDTAYIWEIIMQGMFYASIVIYPASLVIQKTNARVAELLMMNPAAQIIQDLRYLLVSQETPTLYGLSGKMWIAAIPVAIALMVFIVGAWNFRRQSPYFAEEV